MSSVSMSVDSSNVEEGIKKVMRAITFGSLNGVKKVQDKTHDYAKMRLDLFKHTSSKESYKGLVKQAIRQNRSSIIAEITQKSMAGVVLEYKIDTDSGAGMISLNNSKQQRAHKWLRSKGFGKNTDKGPTAFIRKDSQISTRGPKVSVQPMTNAFDKITMSNGPKIMGNSIMKEVRRRI